MIGEWEGSVETAGLNHPYRLAKDGVHKESAEKKCVQSWGNSEEEEYLHKGMLSRYKLLVFRFVKACSKNKMITLQKM